MHSSPYPDELEAHIGKHKLELPSPSLCLSLPTIEENARKFHEKVKNAGVDFRAHVKTTKTAEVSRILLGNSSKRVVVSTLREIRGLESLISDGVVEDVLYGVPFGPSMLPELDQLSKRVTIRLLVDNNEHISLLTKFIRDKETRGKPWSVFIKLDMAKGNDSLRRAGLAPNSDALKQLIKLVEAAPNIELYGLYTYSASGSSAKNSEDARQILVEHVEEILRVAELVQDKERPLVLSVGSSPIANVIGPIAAKVPANITFEIHAGTIIYNDLQQVATGTVGTSGMAMSVIAEICSIYPGRNEGIVSAGVLALTREPGKSAGIARVRGHDGWIIDRVTQEHGILLYEAAQGKKVEEEWKIGDKLELDVQHTCIVGAMYGWHFVTNDEGIVIDVYYPWKWW